MTGRALDADWLRAQRPARHDEKALVQRIRQHLDEHDGYVSLSGGKDSLVVLHLAVQADANVPVAFFDSGLEFPETIAYLNELESFFKISIDTYRATPSLLDVLVAGGGFDHHSIRCEGADLDRLLIQEPAGRAAADHGCGVLWGLRAQESRQRAGLFSRSLPKSCICCSDQAQRRRRHGGVSVTAAGVRFSPVWDWTDHDIWAHITRHQLPVNPVYRKLRELGAPAAQQRVSHLVDGAHLDRGRVVWIRAGWPQLWQPLVEALPRLDEFI